ncbi:MAG: transcriptional regulator [Terracidiphilus sp.]
MTSETPVTIERLGANSPPGHDPRLFAELWLSLASLLRSYTAVHGLSGSHHATVEHSEDKIKVRHGQKWLHLERSNASVTWMRENGSGGAMELTDHGCLRGPAGEEAMDMAAESWARDLMLQTDTRD